MADMWRVIDTGLRPATQNITLNRALLEARHAEEIPSTLRFFRVTPCALLACRQSPAQEFDLDACRTGKVDVQRRITGGAAVYADETAFGWELYLHRRDVGAVGMEVVARRICHAAATAIGALGVDARFRARHDIEVDGRAISTGGGAVDGGALLYQGILQIDADAGRRVRVLRTPTAAEGGESSVTGLEDCTGLQQLLGRSIDPARIKANMIAAFESEFEVEYQDGELSLSEHVRYQQALVAVSAPDWVNLVQQPAFDAPLCDAVQECAGGLLHVRLIYDRSARRIKQVCFRFEPGPGPRRTIADLQAALRDTAIERLVPNVRGFFAGRAVDVSLPASEDFIAVVRRAIKFPLVARS